MKRYLHPSSISNQQSAILLTSVFCLLSSYIMAGFDFNSQCQQAQMEVLDLRIATARKILVEEKSRHPENAYVIYLEHFADIVELIVTDDEELYDALINKYTARLSEMDRHDDGSPFNGILQAEMLFYVGLAQVKYGSRVGGAAKIYNSYREVSHHLDKYPDFTYNLKMAGMYNIMMDFIPNQVRWISEILGVSGDSKLGLSQLMKYYETVKTQPGRAQEAILIINLAYKLTWQEDQGLAFISMQGTQLTDNVLATYTWALSAAFCHDNDLALEKLNELQGRKTEVPFYAMMYLRGRCMLNRLDLGAEVPLIDYIEEYPGEDFKKDASHRLSLLHILQGDTAGYNLYRSMVHVIGNHLRDRDQEALIESQSAIVPHTGLLKARFLFDGGYYWEADSVLSSIPEESVIALPYRLEYHYRTGRINQVLGREAPAIAFLRMAVVAGAGQPYTFATRAALQLAIIFEGQGDHEQALEWYKKCLEYYDPQYTPGGVADIAEKGVKRLLQERKQ